VKTLEIRGRTGTSRILVGESVRRLGRYLPAGRTVLVTDPNVRRALPALFSGFETIEIPAGEASKGLETVSAVYDRLCALEADRSTFVLGVGGGVVCDIAGFAASTYLRGLAFGYAPTSLLAQADAAVGGKTGVNFRGFKNLVGVIRQPRFVLCDPETLETLPSAEVRNGLAEIVKHAAIADARFFGRLERRAPDLLALRPAAVAEAVGASVAIKAAIVSKDEEESGERRKLNFGHTLGHALEAALGLSHGEAVGIGMAASADISVRRGLLPPAAAERLRTLLRSYGLPAAAVFDKEPVLAALARDKKRSGSNIRFAFLRRIGEAVLGDLGLEELRAYVQDLR